MKPPRVRTLEVLLLLLELMLELGLVRGVCRLVLSGDALMLLLLELGWYGSVSVRALLLLECCSVVV